MVMTSQMVGWLVGKVLLLISYVIVVTLVGFSRAWVAKYMGDDAPERLGFLTLNPFVHISFLWIGFISFFTNFGFGQYIPVNIHRFTGRWRWLQMFVSMFSDSIAAFGIAFFAILSFIICFSRDMSFFWGNFHNVIIPVRANSFETIYSTGFINFSETIKILGLYIASSYGIILALLIMAVVHISIFLATCGFLLNLGYALATKLIERWTKLLAYTQWVMIIVPLFLFVFYYSFLDHQVRVALFLMTCGFSHIWAFVVGS